MASFDGITLGMILAIIVMSYLAVEDKLPGRDLPTPTHYDPPRKRSPLPSRHESPENVIKLTKKLFRGVIRRAGEWRLPLLRHKTPEKQPKRRQGGSGGSKGGDYFS